MRNFTESEYEQMDRYIHQQMPEAERQAFEQILQSDSEWADEVAALQALEVNYRYLKTKEYFKNMHQRLKDAGELEEDVTPVVALGTIQAANQPEGSSSGGRVIQFPVRQLAIAAVVLVLVSVGVYVLVINQPNKPEVADHSTATTTLSSSASTTTSTTTDTKLPLQQLAQDYAQQLPKEEPPLPKELSSAVNAYHNNQPDEAIAQLNTLPKATTPKSDEPLFGSSKELKPAALSAKSQQIKYLYLGLSYLKKGSAQQALTQLNKVTDAALKATAQWYQALALLQLSQLEQAKQRLETIQNNPNHPYQLEAQELLNQL